MATAPQARENDRLDELRIEMVRGFGRVDGELVELRGKLADECRSLRAEIKGEARSLRAEIKDEARSLRGEIKNESRELRAEMTSLRGEVGAQLALVHRGLDSVNRSIVGFAAAWTISSAGVIATFMLTNR